VLRLLSIVLALVFCLPAQALTPVKMPQLLIDRDAFEVRSGSRKHAEVIGLGELERLGLYALDMHQTRFEGVLLRDLLEARGMASLEAIIVFTRDGAAHVVSAQDWQKYPLLIATRERGRFLAGEGRLPTQLVYPIDEFPELDSKTFSFLRLARFLPHIRGSSGQMRTIPFELY